MWLLFCLMKSVSGPIKLSILSPVKLLPKFSNAGGGTVELGHDGVQVGLIPAVSTARQLLFGASADPKSMETKFCPIRPVNLTTALLSVFTMASA